MQCTGPRGAVLALALCVLGCGDRKVDEARDLVQRKLGDAKPAEFAEVTLSEQDPEVVCGLVISEDGFDDHTRLKRFFANLRTKEAQVDPHQALMPQARGKVGGRVKTDAAEFEMLYRKMC